MILEAAAALSYFKLWREIPLEWVPKSQNKIPADWLRIDQRQSKVSGINRNASHPVNALLNYAYAVLESQVRIACAMVGIDTSLSYLHAMKNGRSSLIFDLMEPLRPRIEAKIIQFLKATKFAKEDFLVSIQGACKVNPQLARRIVTLGVPDSEVLGSVVRFRDQLLSFESYVQKQ